MLGTAGIVAGVLIALAGLGWTADRALLWMETRGWVYWRKRKGLKAMGVHLMREGSPAAQALERAMQDELKRKNVRPAQAPPFDVDLDTGIVRIRPNATGDAGKKTHPGGKEAAHE